MSLVFNLNKADAQPIKFNINKRQKFIVELYWETKHDLDVHAFLLTQGKMQEQDDLISYCNESLVLVDEPSKNHSSGCKKPFMNTYGGVKHLGDARSGLNLDSRLPDEVLEININLLPTTKNELPIFVCGYPQNSVTFKEVNNCYLKVKDDTGVELFQANLTSEFDQFTGVQMGSFIKTDSGWEFKPVAVGFSNGLEQIISAYS